MGKIDHPSRDPEYARAVAKGQKLAKKLKFESEGMRRDYERAIASNPINVYGLPQFAPPVVIKESYAVDSFDGQRAREFLFESGVYVTDLWCQWCDRLTEHSVGRSQGFCARCGHLTDHRSAPF
jgi:hypothetical protein